MASPRGCAQSNPAAPRCAAAAPRCLVAVRTATRRAHQLPRAATTAPRRPKITPPRRSFLALPQGEALPVVGGLIGANCLVYGAWQVVDPRLMTKHFTLSNDDVLQYPHTLVTSFFSHASGWHLLGNMVTLFFFGPEAIGALGAARFLMVYGGAGLAANGAQLATNAYANMRRDPYFRTRSPRCLGASGAVNAAVAYGCLLNLLTALVWRSLEGQSSVPFTRGFTAWTWAVVAAQAASGYAIGALLKYVDAIGQVFADVIAMLITVVFRVVAFGIYILRVNDAGDGVDAALRPRHELPVRGRAAALRRVARGLLLGPDHDGPRGAACGACAADRTRAAEGRRVLRLGALCGVVVVAGPVTARIPLDRGPRPTTSRWRRRLCVKNSQIRSLAFVLVYRLQLLMS